jgi:2'-5' RNA ligase
VALEDVDFYSHSVCYVRAESFGLVSLQQQLVQLLPPEAQHMHYKRPYVPHITLAQLYEPKKLDELKISPADLSRELGLPRQFTVDSVTCFRRILPREYRPETIT